MSGAPVAAVDCGTNSIRLLVAEPAAGGALLEVHREMRIVRLGQGVDATGAFTEAALGRTEAALADYVEVMRGHGVGAVRMVATSAARDVTNRAEFFAMTARVLGAVAPGAVAEVISGAEEAQLSFAGAVGELPDAAAPFVVVDLGGGSTEVVLGDADGVRASFSADIGCVRLTERFLHSDPPSPDEAARARALVRERLSEALAVVPVESARTWVGVAGTFTTLVALALDMPVYDPAALHLATVDVAAVLEVCDRLIAMPAAERARLGPMHEGRADVVAGGAIVVQESAAQLAAHAGIQSLTVSERDILDGIALSLAG